MLINITTLPGDGIGPEVTDQAVHVLQAVAEAFDHRLKITQKNIGGAALVANNDPLPSDTVQSCLASGAVLLGAVGGPAFDSYPSRLRPEAGLLRLRSELGVFANLRPAICLLGLESLSPLREEIVRGTDVMIARELLGGLYFGERSTKGDSGRRRAVDTMSYSEPEIERIARIGFQLARQRRKELTSVDKANVLDSSRLWREVVNRIGSEFKDVQLSHMYVDSAAMALVSRPTQFDVILTENMFGDILSDAAAALVGSIGLIPSASFGSSAPLFEPIHGSAPSLAGTDSANPIGSVLSATMMLRDAFGLSLEADWVEQSLQRVLAGGYRTPDISEPGVRAVGGSVFTEILREEMQRTFEHAERYGWGV